MDMTMYSSSLEKIKLSFEIGENKSFVRIIIILW